MRVVISKTNASPNCKDQYLPKKRSRTNKGTAIKKTCLFSGLSKELDLTDFIGALDDKCETVSSVCLLFAHLFELNMN